MDKNISEVMSSSAKGSVMVDVVPTIENVDYNRIYCFRNDPNFGFFKANRDLNKKHIKDIENAIENGTYKAKYIAPIRIDINTLKVIDGQHRYEAFKKAWKNGSDEIMRVIFEDLPEDEKEKLDVVIDINSSNSNWSINAYQKRLREEGNKHILNIEEFGKTHARCQKKNSKGEVIGFYPRYVYAIIMGRNISNEVKNGTIRVTDSDIEFGEKMHYELDRLVSALGYKINSWFESFAFAWYNIRKNDKANSELIDELGMDVICQNIKSYFEGWQVVTRKTDWENRFRAAIWEIKRQEIKAA